MNTSHTDIPKNNYDIMKKKLHSVPEGTIEIHLHTSDSPDVFPLKENFHADTSGRGQIDSYLLFPGIEISYHQLLADKASFYHESLPNVLEITYCHSGRIGWNMEDGVSLYLGNGDLAFHSMNHCAHSEMQMPLGYYEGLTVSIDFEQLKNTCPELLRTVGFDFDQMLRKFSQPAAIPSQPDTEHIFSVLYHSPEVLRIPYSMLKVQELLLFLYSFSPDTQSELLPRSSQQTELIREVHKLLTENLEHRYTIEELSKRYPINSSTLKTVFKTVYGMPVASYMKQYRIRKAIELLRNTDESISSIALQVGYETPGKFTKAFKDITQMLPKEYRKQTRTAS